MKTDNSPPRGTRDLLPANVAVRDHALATIERVYSQFGYQKIETPALEDLVRLTGGQGGENEKMIFKVLKRGLPPNLEAGAGLSQLADLGLRFDLTVPLARFYGQHHAHLPNPFRAFQFGPVWRAERPQKGRYRQFYQCDIDILGEPTVIAEVELIEATTQALSMIGLAETTLRLSDRRFLSSLAASVGLVEESWSTFFIGLDKLDKIGWDGVGRELVDNRGLPGERVDAALLKVRELSDLPQEKLIDGITQAVPLVPDEVLADLTATTTALSDISGSGHLVWQFDPSLVRGMGYYTGQIFEIAHPDLPSSVAGGGRYDNLIGRSLGEDVPACGFSIGFERIVNLLDQDISQDSLALLYAPDTPTATVLAASRRLRADGYRVSTIRRSGKLGAQLGRLEGWGFTAYAHVVADADPGDTLLIQSLGSPSPRLTHS